MKTIAYTGRSDARALNADDLKKAGVDLTNAKQTEFMFERRIATEVTNEVADALIGNPRLFGNFEEVDAPVGQRFDIQNQLDFSSIEEADTKAPEAGEVLDTPQTGVDAPAAAPRRSSTRSTS